MNDKSRNLRFKLDHTLFCLQLIPKSLLDEALPCLNRPFLSSGVHSMYVESERLRDGQKRKGPTRI